MSWEIEAKSSSGEAAGSQGKVLIMYDDGRQMEEGRG
jgi:hypothetical protein